MREWSSSGGGVRTPGSYTFSSRFGHLQKCYVSLQHKDVSLRETPLVVCYLQKDFCLQGEFCNHQEKAVLWKSSGFGTKLWTSPGEPVFSKVAGYPHICPGEEMSESS